MASAMVYSSTSTLHSTPDASTAEPPPSYDGVRRSHAAILDSSPDPYTARHSFFIRTSNGAPWLTLNIRSRATSARYLPLYCDKDIIRGDVTLDLQGSMRAKAIVLKYRCRVSKESPGPSNGIVFDTLQYIWGPENGAAFGVLPQGRRTIPFAFPVPHEMPDPKEPGRMIALPPTFSERGGSPVYIDYTLSVSLRKPGLQISRKITTGVGYFPRSVCGTPSPLRILASQTHASLLGPELDPMGWRTLPPVSIEGTAVSARAPIIEYKLAVAEPVCASIHEALDLATSGANVHLRRIVENPEQGPSDPCRTIARASFSPYERTAAAHGESTRTFLGELTIPAGTTPSFTFTNIVLRYDVVLRNLTNLVPSPVTHKSPKHGGKPLCSVEIVVTAASPRRLEDSFASLPPAYDQ